jgi:hypothetical protein
MSLAAIDFLVSAALGTHTAFDQTYEPIGDPALLCFSASTNGAFDAFLGKRSVTLGDGLITHSANLLK